MSKYSKLTFKTESPAVAVAIANPMTVSGHRLPWLGHSRFLKVAPSDKSSGRPIFVLPFKTRGAISPAGCNLYQEWRLEREGDIGAGSADDSGSTAQIAEERLTHREIGLKLGFFYFSPSLEEEERSFLTVLYLQARGRTRKNWQVSPYSRS